MCTGLRYCSFDVVALAVLEGEGMDRVLGPLVLGVDGGTESIRVGLFTLDGELVTVAREPYVTTHARPGWAEQDPADWWRGLRDGVRRVLADSGAAPDQVKGMSLACTCFTMVAVGADDRPLRPALLWMDVRSAAEADRIAGSGAEALRISAGTHASAEWMLSKAMWLRRHERGVYEATRWLADYVEWLTFRLTGMRSTSVNSAAIRGYYDRLAGGWPTQLWDSVDMHDLRERVAPQVLLMGEQVGGLGAEPAAELGLRAGTPVAQGGADAFVAMLGLGVTGPGTVAMVTGSSHVHMLQAERPCHVEGLFGSYTDAVVPGQFTLEGGQTSTGSVVNWLIRLLRGRDCPPGQVASTLAELNRAAGDLPPGADGLLALDYWQGNRTPHVDPRARGMFWGLSLVHEPAHLFRAVIESICYGTEGILGAMRSSGRPIEAVVACGGALNSPFWLQTHADVSGVPIRTTRVNDAAMLGAAILAALGAGLYRDMPEASAAMVAADRVIEPRRALTEQYRPLLGLYTESYDAMKPLLHRAADLADREPSR